MFVKTLGFNKDCLSEGQNSGSISSTGIYLIDYLQKSNLLHPKDSALQMPQIPMPKELSIPSHPGSLVIAGIISLFIKDIIAVIFFLAYLHMILKIARTDKYKAHRKFVIGRRALLNRDFKKAIKFLSESKELVPSNTVILLIAQIYAIKGDYLLSIKYYETYLKAKPEDKNAIEEYKFLLEKANNAN